MAHFYGTLDGSAQTTATRQGGKKNGLVTHCASYSGSARCEAYVDKFGVDCVRISLTPWLGHGIHRILYDGPFNPETNEKDE